MVSIKQISSVKYRMLQIRKSKKYLIYLPILPLFTPPITISFAAYLQVLFFLMHSCVKAATENSRNVIQSIRFLSSPVFTVSESVSLFVLLLLLLLIPLLSETSSVFALPPLEFPLSTLAFPVFSEPVFSPPVLFPPELALVVL